MGLGEQFADLKEHIAGGFRESRTLTWLPTRPRRRAASPGRAQPLLVFGLPPAALVAGGWLAWGGALNWDDLVVLAITYTLTGLGITVGYHRLFTHRSFKTSRPVRAALAVLGRRPFPTGDQSRNLAWLAPLAFGEAWHNNHHAFPTSARHGLRRWQVDPGGWLIAGLERCHLAWDVIRISPTRQQAKLRPE